MIDAPEYRAAMALVNKYRRENGDDSVDVIQPLGPYEKVKAGDVYRFTRDVLARSGHIFEEDDELRVIEPTGQIPFFEVGPDGVNWKVLAGNGLTVWATLEQCISRGLVVKVR